MSQVFTIRIDGYLKYFCSLEVGDCYTFFSIKGCAGGIRRQSKNYYCVYFIKDGFCTGVNESSFSSALKTLRKFFDSCDVSQTSGKIDYYK